MTREAALHTLLSALFSSQELRLHLALEREGDDLVSALPEGVARSALIAEAIEALKRRGFVDRDFFDRLEDVRPRRRNEIREVRALWLHNARLDRGALWAENRYELITQCGSGGFGLVWKAIDIQTKIYVALKILHEMYTDNRGIRQRFFRGAAVLAELDHPAIVRVRSSVEQEGLRFFYVMDYIDGESLDVLVGRRPRDMLLEYILQVGDALACIHARDLLHRDIKPSNILVNKRGQAKLIDFDLVTGETFAPLTTRAFGTAIYAPPEAATSDQKTAAYDVYGLARTVEFVLRGREPTVAELTDVDPVAGLDAPEAIKDVLRAALCADPSRRTSSVERFCKDLRAGLAPIRPPEPQELESRQFSKIGIASSDPPAVNRPTTDESVHAFAPASDGPGTTSISALQAGAPTNKSRLGTSGPDAPLFGRRPFAWLAGSLSVTTLAGVLWYTLYSQREQTVEVVGRTTASERDTQASPAPLNSKPPTEIPGIDPSSDTLVSDPVAELQTSALCAELLTPYTEVAPMCVATPPEGESTMGSLNDASTHSVKFVKSGKVSMVDTRVASSVSTASLEQSTWSDTVRSVISQIAQRRADLCDAKRLAIYVVIRGTGTAETVRFRPEVKSTKFTSSVTMDIVGTQWPKFFGTDRTVTVPVVCKGQSQGPS